jgi:hypothetical protein
VTITMKQKGAYSECENALLFTSQNSNADANYILG